MHKALHCGIRVRVVQDLKQKIVLFKYDEDPVQFSTGIVIASTLVFMLLKGDMNPE